MPEKTIDELVNELEAKRLEVLSMGGPSKVEEQKAKGKLTARERLSLLLDEGSFVELDMFVEHRCTEFGMDRVKAPADGVVAGYGKVNGRLVFVYSQDFTVVGGSLGEMHAKKICKVADLALKMGAPLIGINDSGGARIQEGVDSLSGYGQIFFRNTISSGVIPQIAVIVGPCAGGAVYSPALMDFVFMVKGIGLMHITGPQVIKAVTGEDVTSEELGGALTHNQKSGVAHFACDTEVECFSLVRKLLSYIPQNNMEDPPYEDTGDDPGRMEISLREIVPVNPNKAYDVRDVIKLVVDRGEFFEVQELYAPNIVIGFARLSGYSIGIIANQPRHLAGCLDIDSCDKASRFIRFCDAFNIPIVNFVDVPGYLPGTAQEWGGIIRHGAKMLYAYSEATVPKLTVILRKAYGGAYLGMCSKDLGADVVLAWPQAEIAVMGAEGAANIIFRKEIQSASNPEEVRRQKIEEYREKFANPYVAAKRGFVDRVIKPEETRPALIESLVMALSKREARPKKKHGVMPV
ncbi:MAG: carboxyl transferase domain-containing protein [Candidatus Bathyarchaeia archaeon]